MHRLLALLLLLPAQLAAQMTVEGRVTDASGAPVAGASVRAAALDISVRTTADGRYNFIIRQAQIRGQTVELTARHSRFGTASVQLRITGGSVAQDFVLGAAARVPDRRPRDTSVAAPQAAGVAAEARPGRRIPFDDLTSPDLASAVAGRFAPLQVDGASAPGGSAVATHRGIRSLFGATQPLVVVDGVPVDNQGFTTIPQRFGLGGYDYGTPAQDLAVADIASITLLDGASAACAYGARGANGVIHVVTRDGRGISGLQFTVTPRISLWGVGPLPAYQNRYGQGLGGAFEFFDGRGGGVHDEIAQSWGPALDGSPVAQHSLTEAGRPDVRYWLPRPDGVRGYFDDATDAELSVAVLGSRGPAHGRAAINYREAAGLTPGASLHRLGGTLNGGADLSSRLQANGTLRVVRANAAQRPGTGFDEVNPVAGFARFGRQVDIDALRDNLLDADGNQINWIYTARNNPFFATTLNENEDTRTQVIAGGTLSFALARSLTSSARVGTADYSESRSVNVARGWQGGFPTTLGRGDFGGGGADRSSYSAGERFANVDLVARHAPWRATEIVSSVGAGIRVNDFDTRASVTDQPLVGAAAVTNLSRSGRDDARSANVRVAMVRNGNLALDAGTRLEQTDVAGQRFSAFFPSVSLSYDLARRQSVRERFRVGQARLRAAAWRAGNEVNSRLLTQMYFGGGIPIAPINDISGPERVTGVELGATLESIGKGLVLDLTGYRERSTDLLVAAAAGDGSAVLAQTGQIFNSGYELVARTSVLGGDTFSWDIGGSFARNVNTVDALQPGAVQTALSPGIFGARSDARIGAPAGVIVGSRYLRTADGALVLRDGVPLPDATAPFAMLGSTMPDWTGALHNRFRYHGIELQAWVDASVGGHLFSATNLWGSYAGTLESTLIGDRSASGTPNDSLLITGVDSVTGAANTIRVSAEDYFHALGAIAEPWVYDASVLRLRTVQVAYEMPAGSIPGLREHAIRVSLIARNLAVWSKAPNVDPGGTFSSNAFRGFEMGQLPGVRSWTLHVSLSP